MRYALLISCCLLIATNWAHSAAEPDFEINMGDDDNDAPNLVSGDTFSIDFPDETVYAILDNVRTLQDLDVDIPPELKQIRTSVKLRNVGWRQVFEVVLEPVGYTYLEEGNGEILIMTQEAMAALPLRVYRFTLQHISPEDAIDYTGDRFDAAAGEKATFSGNELRMLIHPSKWQHLKSSLERLDQSRGLPKFPKEIYWPESLPKHFTQMLRARAKIKDTPRVTRVYLIDKVSAQQMKTKLDKIAEEHQLKMTIQVDRLSNSLLITGVPPAPNEIMPSKDGSGVMWSSNDFEALIDYLDDKRWYNPQESTDD